jgi:methionine salvage enolase-phosphatase E1
MGYTTITYIGKSGKGYTARVGKTFYEFEWQKGLAIGKRQGEVHPDHVKKIAKWRDKKGKRIFVLE